ncbi:hypothetical protein QZH41_014068 [Actinostola sp. cb2023]|nr:hypothetical protein QZH41_014068 [Actinostola sp. cb2023]
MTFGIYGGHAFLIKNIGKLARTYACAHCRARFTQATPPTTPRHALCSRRDENRVSKRESADAKTAQNEAIIRESNRESITKAEKENEGLAARTEAAEERLTLFEKAKRALWKHKGNIALGLFTAAGVIISSVVASIVVATGDGVKKLGEGLKAAGKTALKVLPGAIGAIAGIPTSQGLRQPSPPPRDFSRAPSAVAFLRNWLGVAFLRNWLGVAFFRNWLGVKSRCSSFEGVVVVVGTIGVDKKAAREQPEAWRSKVGLLKGLFEGLKAVSPGMGAPNYCKMRRMVNITWKRSTAVTIGSPLICSMLYEIPDPAMAHQKCEVFDRIGKPNAKSFEEHLHRLRLVFSRIRQAGLKLKPAKCQFLKQRVTFLGHVVSSQGIETDPEKTKAVVDWPVPVDVKELQRFLGLVGYYRRFVTEFSTTAEPLYRLCKKFTPFQWGSKEQMAFEELKKSLLAGTTSSVTQDLWSEESLASTQQEDAAIGPVLTSLLQGEGKPTQQVLQSLSPTTRAVIAQFELLEVKNGVLYRKELKKGRATKGQVVLPEKLITPALQQCHDGLAGAHMGRFKTLRKMKARFWRPGLTKRVHEYCDNCLTCCKCKPRKRSRAPLHPIPSGYPMQRIHMDIVGPLPRTKKGNKYVLTMQCSFTKWVEAFPIPNQRATTCARVFVKNWVCKFGVPDSIHTDQGRNFESKVFSEMCKLLEMNKTRSTAYHPEGNGQIENFHRTLKSMIKTRVEEEPDRWDEHMEFCLMAYRSSVHSSTGHTPYELMFGREMRIPVDVMIGMVPEDESSECPYSESVSELRNKLAKGYEDVRTNLQAAQRRQKDAFDKGVRHTVYEPGDLVLRYSPQLTPGEASKFHRNWQGPYTIVERITEITYRIRKLDNNTRRKTLVVHFNNLRLYKRKTEAQAPPDLTSGRSVTTEGAGRQAEDLEDNDRDDAEWVHDDSGYDDAVTVHVSETNEKAKMGDLEDTSPEVNTDNTDDTPTTANISSDVAPNAPSYEDGEESNNSDIENVETESSRQHPTRLRRPPDRYGEWILNSLQLTKLLSEVNKAVQLVTDNVRDKWFSSAELGRLFDGIKEVSNAVKQQGESINKMAEELSKCRQETAELKEEIASMKEDEEQFMEAGHSEDVRNLHNQQDDDHQYRGREKIKFLFLLWRKDRQFKILLEPFKDLKQSPVKDLKQSPVKGLKQSPVKGLKQSPVKGLRRYKLLLLCKILKRPAHQYEPETPRTARAAGTDWTPGCSSGLASGSSLEDLYGDKLVGLDDE